MKHELRNATIKDKLRYYLGYPRRLFALKVAGNSMSPTIKDGAFLLYDPFVNIQIGDIVLSAHPLMHSVKIVKRVAKIASDGMVTLAGDNQYESTDSRTLGAIPIKSIQGRIVCKW